MYVKKKYESKNEGKEFDFSRVVEDSTKYDFDGVLTRLRIFNGWLKKLHTAIGDFENPVISYSSRGTSGYAYSITTLGDTLINFSITCGTNPDAFPAFAGRIYAGGRRYAIRDTGDLTDALIEQLQSSIKNED